MRLRTVLLRHILPDGSSHFDWMLAVDEPAIERMRTWRLVERPDEARVGSVLEVKPLVDHRATYLDFEGPLSGDRGRVEQVRTGWWTPEAEIDVHGEGLLFSVDWGEGTPDQHWSIRGDQAHRLG